MFFDGFDIYPRRHRARRHLEERLVHLAGECHLHLGDPLVGMMLGSFATGFPRRPLRAAGFTYSIQSAAVRDRLAGAAFAPNMAVLIACRFVMGFGLGAENVVGYATMTEFVPAKSRRQMVGVFTTVCVVTGLPISLLVASLIHSAIFGWRSMFVLGGIGALIVWYLRKALPRTFAALARGGRPRQPRKPKR